MIRTLAAAAGWIDETGLALVFPKADVVLPSLWEQVNGSAERNWRSAIAEGGFVAWTEEMGFLWGAKDELPAQGLACVGKHLGRVAPASRRGSCRRSSRRTAMRQMTSPSSQAIREHGPLTGPQLREATGLAKKEVDRAVASLHHRLVLTSSHLVEQDGPWGALAHDLTCTRKWDVPADLPSREDARRELAAIVLDQAGELTAADLAGALALAAEGGGGDPRRDRRRTRRRGRVPHLDAAVG